MKKEKSVLGIPVKHVKWIGTLLSQLTDEQLKGYIKTLRERINQLPRM